MGAQLVGKAFALAARTSLTPQQALLLTFMSLKALDSESPPRYFASREASALGLGRMLPEEPNPSSPDAVADNATRAAAFDRVKKTTRGLERAGAIKCVRRGREGQTSEYHLIYGDSSGRKTPPWEGRNSPP